MKWKASSHSGTRANLVSDLSQSLSLICSASCAFEGNWVGNPRQSPCNHTGMSHSLTVGKDTVYATKIVRLVWGRNTDGEGSFRKIKTDRKEEDPGHTSLKRY